MYKRQICIFIKPQAFIFTPILIFGIIENVFIKDFSKEKLLKNLGFGVSAIIPVSYTHLDVYKRQVIYSLCSLSPSAARYSIRSSPKLPSIYPSSKILNLLLIRCV